MNLQRPAMLTGLISMQLGVYELQDGLPEPQVRSRFVSIDQRMGMQGFYPVVRVHDSGEHVGIYARDDSGLGMDALRILVVQPNEVVILLLDGQLDPLAMHLARGDLGPFRQMAESAEQADGESILSSRNPSHI